MTQLDPGKKIGLKNAAVISLPLLSYRRNETPS